MHPLAEALLADAGQVFERVGRQPARLRIGAGQHDPHQLGLLLSVERRRASVTPAVGEAADPVLVVAQHPVAQRLAVHARCFRRRLPAHAVERVGDCQDAPRHAAVGLPLGQLAQHRRGAILAYLQRRHEPSLESSRLGNHDPRAKGIAARQHESIHRLAGITRR